MDWRRPARAGGAAAVLAMALVMGGGDVRAQDSRTPALAAEQPYLQENGAAMDRMMTGMAAAPTGNLDRDFVTAMASHHQGAIDMAQAYLRHGGNEQLRRISQEIVVEQQQEIAAMGLAIGAPTPPVAPPAAPAGTTATPNHTHPISAKATR